MEILKTHRDPALTREITQLSGLAPFLFQFRDGSWLAPPDR
jgi:hypothetical protein